MALDKEFVAKNGLIANGNLIFARGNSGQVGINTSNPDANVAIVGTANVSGNVALAAVTTTNVVIVTSNTTVGTSTSNVVVKPTDLTIRDVNAITVANSSGVSVGANVRLSTTTLNISTTVANSTVLVVAGGLNANATHLVSGNTSISTDTIRTGNATNYTLANSTVLVTTGNLTVNGTGLFGANLQLNQNLLVLGSSNTVGRVASNTYFSSANGYYTTTYKSNDRNPIWRFENSDSYGLSYFQGAAGQDSSDTVAFHFGNTSIAGSAVKIRSDGMLFANTIQVGANTITGYSNGYLVTSTFKSLGQANVAGSLGVDGNLLTRATLTTPTFEVPLNQPYIAVKTSTLDHGYVAYYTASANTSQRTAYQGFAGPGSIVYEITNERSGGSLTLNAQAGTNILNSLAVSGPINITGGANITGNGNTSLVGVKLNASDLASGRIPTAVLASGVANTTTYLRGDGVWTLGTQGNTGPQGIQGDRGYTGSIGYTGSQGVQGIQGPQGVQGPLGYTGSAGPQGVQGPQGIQGPLGYTGSIGATGPQGPQGNQGVQGVQGPQGPLGYTGSQGTQGVQGPQGNGGPQGPQGYTGSVGSQGPQGNQGVQGNQGPQGGTGAQGPIGYTGSQGVQGVQGNTGAQGPQGNSGPQGGQGPQGVAGYTGSQGAQGAQGVQGPQGGTGPQGPTGPTGNTGATGPQGAQGIQGPQGPAGPSGASIYNSDFRFNSLGVGRDAPGGGQIAFTGAMTMPVSTWHNTNDGYQRLHFGSSSHTYYKSPSHHIFRTGNSDTDKVLISPDGGIFSVNDITAFYSDMRLKTKVGALDNALDKVCSLSGFKFKSNETAVKLGYDANTVHIGLSAQEVKAVLPEVIKPAVIDSKYMTLDYAKLVPLLVEAIKELNAKIEELKK